MAYVMAMAEASAREQYERRMVDQKSFLKQNDDALESFDFRYRHYNVNLYQRIKDDPIVIAKLGQMEPSLAMQLCATWQPQTNRHHHPLTPTTTTMFSSSPPFPVSSSSPPLVYQPPPVSRLPPVPQFRR